MKKMGMTLVLTILKSVKAVVKPEGKSTTWMRINSSKVTLLYNVIFKARFNPLMPGGNT